METTIIFENPAKVSRRYMKLPEDENESISHGLETTKGAAKNAVPFVVIRGVSDGT